MVYTDTRDSEAKVDFKTAVMNGMNVSMIASPMMNTSVRIVGVLNSRTHLESRLSMDTLPFPNGMVQSYNITNKV